MKKTSRLGGRFLFWSFLGFGGFLLGIWFGGSLQGEEPAESTKNLRIVSYNIQIALGLGTARDYNDQANVRDYDRTAGVLKRLDPDVVGLQEVDRRTKRSAGDDQITELAERTGLFPTFGPAIPLPGSETGADGASIPGEYGIGILSKEKPLATRVISLPGREEKRALLIAEFTDFVLFNTHFSLTSESRAESMEIINRQLDRETKPVILVGDFNFHDFSEADPLLKKGWTPLTPDVPTFPADNPRVRLDFVWVADPTGKIPPGTPWSDRVTETFVVEEPAASDHRPVFVELKGVETKKGELP